MVLTNNSKPESTIAQNLPYQPAENQTSDKEIAPAQRRSRKASRNEEPRTASSSITRKIPRQRLHPVERSNSQIHPPLLLDWNNCNPSMSKDERMLPPGHLMASPHDMQEIPGSYPPLQWDPQLSSQMDMSNRFDDHCMIPPTSMPNMDQGAYIDSVFNSVQQQSSYRETDQTAHFPKSQKFSTDIHDPRSIPFRDGAHPYETPYMMPPSQSQEMMQRAYFGM